MKEAKKTQITEQICKQARLMRRGGANQTEIGKLLGINPCTVSRMEKAEFDFAKYQELLKERRAKERKQPEPEAAEEQVPGQIVMELTADKLTVTNPPKPITDIQLIDQDKLMRFMAAQNDRMIIQEAQWMDELCMKIDKLNDTMSQILRAIRKE